jgi:hypothetical protein
MIEQDIAKHIRDATRTTPSQEQLRALEREVQKLVTPTVRATMDPITGRLTIRVEPQKIGPEALAFVIQPAEVRILVEDEP